ncbi:hypothetical protein GCM10023185_43580 [Hymenobacter saemangeumensis]|uniref:T9SS type A sorting domain-containing protein n=1 Tax=Hymenobacter saemangeumensis TaxID=1084522 RepID=A0ABP8IS01_9BACT
MRRNLYLSFVLLAVAPLVAVQAQTSPSIVRADLPAVNDTLRLSQAAAVLPATAPPLTRRGANQTWNYSSLVAVSQRVERYLGPATVTGQLIQLTFNSLFSGANRANLASPTNLPLPAGTALPISDVHEFYNAATADYRSVGFSANLSGTGVPVTYQQGKQDIIYKLPISYSSLPDSCNSYFEVSVPMTGFLSQRRKRVNKVDAWGTLTTPFGTFQTVRLVTRLEDHDSIAIGGMAGQGITLPVRREYKWLARTSAALPSKVPVLTITTTMVGGQETITNVEYRDTYRRPMTLGTHDAAMDAALAAYPNPSAVGSPLTLTVPAGSAALQVSATDLAGRQLFRRQLTGVSGSIELGAELFGSFRGVALLTVTTARGTATRRVARL